MPTFEFSVSHTGIRAGPVSTSVAHFVDAVEIMLPNTAAPAATSSSGWSFNLRTSKIKRPDHDLDDSGSDSDPSSDSGVDESRILDDLDISTRDETVVYKPNPFSIAKINAAARSTNRPPSTKEPPRPIKPTKAGRKTTGSIVDGLRKQSEKAKSKSQRASLQPNATLSTVRFSSKTQQERAPTSVSVPRPPTHPEHAHIYGDLAPSASEATSISYAPLSPLRSSHVQAAETVPRPFRPPMPVPVRLMPTPAPPSLYRNEVPRKPDPEGTSFPRFTWNSPVIPSLRADQQPKAPVSNKNARSSHKRQRTSPSPPKAVRPNAYEPSIDPDEEWSTLHRRKKHMAETATVGMRTGAFSLPGISAPGKKSGMSATSSKRVITFLPPPLVSTSDDMPVDQQKQKTQERPKSQNPYPSPTHSTLSSLIPACADVTNREHQASDETAFSSPYRPLSPPSSDLHTVVEPPSEGNPMLNLEVSSLNDFSQD
ncbi:hypothetical protein IW262DRAFT_1298378 [Armillaria fumosa]|nr:hypothetical protein IW262DRAFT_1298378 [Armillaria fumosa]